MILVKERLFKVIGGKKPVDMIDLKQNLTSTGLLDVTGCNLIGLVLEIAKDNLLFMKGHRLPSNLYQFDGSTIIDGATIITEHEVEKFNFDSSSSTLVGGRFSATVGKIESV